MANFCPYYDTAYKKCNISDAYKNESERNDTNGCLTSNWRKCTNYEKSSLDQKVTKKIRQNPDL